MSVYHLGCHGLKNFAEISCMDGCVGFYILSSCLLSDIVSVTAVLQSFKCVGLWETINIKFTFCLFSLSFTFCSYVARRNQLILHLEYRIRWLAGEIYTCNMMSIWTLPVITNVQQPVICLITAFSLFAMNRSNQCSHACDWLVWQHVTCQCILNDDDVMWTFEFVL